jgi:4-hydroxy 2-oxovalerate aldolase
MAKETTQNEKLPGVNEERGIKGWLSYRPEIKVLDCTIRDGGLMNDHKFEDRFIKRMYETCVAAGIDYMELGYKGDKKIFSPTQYGKWKFTDEDHVRKLIGDNNTNLKLSIMTDAERTDYHNDILPCSESIFDMVRVATYIHQIPSALDMIKDANDKGYETAINLMSVSVVQESELEAALEVLARCEAQVIYIVDSFGAYYTEQVQELTRLYLKYAKAQGKEVGIHAHNNQQLAYANTITAIIEGANYLDATIDGMGRGAGNCPLELLIGFLHNPKFRLRPIIECLQQDVLPLKKELNWGYQIPYMLTGQLNLHPRSAIKFLAGDKKDNYLQFYDEIMQEE